ncbi:MAG: ester cyclase [Caldilineaceae bacterium]
MVSPPVVARWTCCGTHSSEYDGIAPTGKALTSTGISIFHFANGRLVDDRFESSIADMRRYLLES